MKPQQLLTIIGGHIWQGTTMLRPYTDLRQAVNQVIAANRAIERHNARVRRIEAGKRALGIAGKLKASRAYWTRRTMIKLNQLRG